MNSKGKFMGKLGKQRWEKFEYKNMNEQENTEIIFNLSYAFTLVCKVKCF